MKKLVYLIALAMPMVIAVSLQSCRFAHRPVDGDTVAANVFEPEDTATLKARSTKARKAVAVVRDSVGIYRIGDGSNRSFLQLVSYPSGRDTLLYGKTRHVRVKGSADLGKVVRVRFYVRAGKDSLVSEVEEVALEN